MALKDIKKTMIGNGKYGLELPFFLTYIHDLLEKLLQ